MVQIEVLAQAVLDGDSLRARSLTQEFFQHPPRLVDIPRPKTTNQRLLVVSAALLELFAERLRQPAPAWTATIGPVEEPVYLLKAAATMKRLRRLCETESPEPLRRRRLYAPPNYLEFV
ncbi:MAG: hypothetical protein FOGNACKC_06041 [Anaerolineae bacterium]|nr:hypothetical protein [Anaerolineae bacterium]